MVRIVVKLIKVLTRTDNKTKRLPVQDRIVRPRDIPSDQRPYKPADRIDFPFPTNMSAVWKDDHLPFTVDHRRDIRKYLLNTWGPGFYRVYKWGGQPPNEEYYQGWTL